MKGEEFHEKKIRTSEEFHNKMQGNVTDFIYWLAFQETRGEELFA